MLLLMVISMDNPSDYLGLDGNITDNDAPVDALAQAFLRGAEAWLWSFDGEHLSLPFYVEGSISEPTGPKLASLGFARLVCLPLYLIQGLKKIQVDLTCMISSEENEGEAGVEVLVELIGFGEARTSLAAHGVYGLHLEQLELEFDAPLAFEGLVELCVWFKSEVETTVTASGLTIIDSDVVRTQIDPGGAVPVDAAAGLYTVQALDNGGGVIYSLDMYRAEYDAGEDQDYVYCSNARSLKGRSARLMALGWIILAGAEVRCIYEGL